MVLDVVFGAAEQEAFSAPFYLLGPICQSISTGSLLDDKELNMTDLLIKKNTYKQSLAHTTVSD